MKHYVITEELKNAIVHELRLRVFPRKELLADLSARVEALPEAPDVAAKDAEIERLACVEAAVEEGVEIVGILKAQLAAKDAETIQWREAWKREHDKGFHHQMKLATAEVRIAFLSGEDPGPQLERKTAELCGIVSSYKEETTEHIAEKIRAALRE